MPSSMDDAQHARAPEPDRPLSFPRAVSSAAPGYETRDADTRAVLLFLAVLFVVLNLTLFGTWRLFRHFLVADVPAPSASSFADERQIPPAPELQVNGRTDLQRMYDKQQKELETYGWEDRQAGIVRIPIDRAMELLLQKGLPVAPAAAQEKSPGENPEPVARTSGGSAPSVASQYASSGDNR